MSNLAVVEQEIRSLQTLFESVQIDRSMAFDREVEFAMQILCANDYTAKLAIGSIQSIKDCITNVAAIGISLNPAKKQAYLVPRKGRICLDISYVGLVDMAVATGSVRWVQAAVVFAADKFTLHGYDRAPSHDFEPFATDRGLPVGVYVVAKTADGDYLTHTMSIGDVYAIRNRSEAWMSGKSCPWKTDENEMIKKTCVKQASKYWPKTERLDKAVNYLNTDGGEGIEFVADTSEPEAPTGRKPAVAMPQAKAAPAERPASDVTDVVEKPAQRPAASSGALASPGEVAYITKRIANKSWSIADAMEAAGMPGVETLDGLTKDGFVSLRDATK